jgi:K+ transporter
LRNPKDKEIRMANTLQTAGLPRQDARKQPTAAVLTALGVVYGDIGTSTLYGLKQQGTQKQRPANSGGLVVLLPSGHLH